MKLDIVSPNHQRKNGSITISGTQRVEASQLPFSTWIETQWG